MMTSYHRPDSSHRLLLGLKRGLMEADREIRQLKDKLFKYLMRDLDWKTEYSDLKENANEKLLQRQQEIEALSKALCDERDRNLNAEFQLKQLEALKDEKVEAIVKLKEESLRAELALKDLKSDTQRRSKSKLKNRRNKLDSKVLPDETRVIKDEHSSFSSTSSSNLYPLPPFDSSAIKVESADIQIERSDFPASSEKSLGVLSICGDNEMGEPQSSPSDTTSGCNEQNLNEVQNQGRSMLGENGLTRAESLSAVTEEKGDGAFEPNRPDISSESKMNSISESIPSSEHGKFVTFDESSSRHEKTLQLRNSVFDPLPDEKYDLLQPSAFTSTDCNMEKSVAMCQPLIVGRKNCFEVNVGRDEKASDEIENVETKVNDNLAFTEGAIAENAREKTTTKKLKVEPGLSPVERLYINERSLENAVEFLLREMITPLKPQTEVDSLYQFYKDITAEDDAELIAKVSQRTEKYSEFGADRSMSTVDILTFLDKISRQYERISRRRATMEAFAQKLYSEQCTADTSTSIDDCSSYVVVFETSKSAFPAKAKFTDIRDEILDDWIVTDCLNEVDLRNPAENESQDCLELEYTSASPPSKNDVLKMSDSAGKVLLETKGDSVLCWIDTDPSKIGVAPNEEVEAPRLLREDEKLAFERTPEDLFDEQRDADESTLIIVENDIAEADSPDPDLIIDEDALLQEELPIEDDDCITIASLDGTATRYNLRRKSSLCKGSASRMRTSNDADTSPVRKIPKLDPSGDSSVLLECDLNLEDNGRNSRTCLPKFYVENYVGTLESNAPLQKTNFELVWSAIKNLKVEDVKIATQQHASLIHCGESMLRTAFKFNAGIVHHSNAHKERITNLNATKGWIEKYLREKKCLSKEAMVNLLSNVAQSNRTTICCAFETLLLNSSKYTTRKTANVFDDLTSICLEIDRRIFDGFVDTMKIHLKEKMFAKVFKVETNKTSGLNMIESTILQSRFYATLCRATRNVNDAISLLYESLTSLKNRAHPIAYGILVQWPDVLKLQPQKRLLVNVILFCYVHHKMHYNSELYRVEEVQKMVNRIYGVKLGDRTAEEYAKESMVNIRSDCWVDAIVLLSKRQMFSWTYTNVIMKYLKPLLRVWRTDAVEEVVLLKAVQALRQIMFACPYEKGGQNERKYNFDAIIETLSDILANQEMKSRALKETVCLAICELSSRNFALCVQSLSSWMPTDKQISSETLCQLNVVMNKKENYHNWATFVAPYRNPRRFPCRRNNYKKSMESDSSVIRVGVTRSFQTQTRQGKKRGNKKKKNGK